MRTVAIWIFIVLLLVYLYCLAPNWGAMTLFNTWDGLEYVITSCLLGMDHPPGHPFYLLLCKLFSLLPTGDPSWNINFLSAFFGAVAVMVLFIAIVELLRPLDTGIGSVLTSLAVSLTFALSYVFWSHCEIPEVHTLQLALAGACVWALLKWHRGGRNAWLYATALFLAVGIGVNILADLALLIPVAILVFFSLRLKRCLAPGIIGAAIVCAGFIPYIYYPLRIAHGPFYSHPMNYLGPYEMGTAAWYRWYIMGKAWTGGQMFFLNRVAGNIPLYLRFGFRDLGPPIFILSLFGILLSLRELPGLFRAIGRGDRSSAGERAVLPFLLLLFAFSLLPEISIHDPSNPRAVHYLQNFFLPSLYLLSLLGAWGAMSLYGAIRARGKEGAVVLLAILLAVPVYQCFANTRSCDLRGQECAYTLSLRTLEQIPRGSVIVSKLVYGMVVEYFTNVEHRIAAGDVSLLDPEVVARGLAKESQARDLFARKNKALLHDVERIVGEGRSVFLAGDIVDEDKSPEKLLLSDLELERWNAQLSPAESRLVYPRELYLYRVTGVRTATPVKSLPADVQKGSANDGKFANGVELLGFLAAAPDRRIREDILSLELFWKSSRPLGGDLYIGVIFLDGAMRRIGEAFWHTLGGSLGAGEWKEGDLIREKVNIFPPPLPPGRYFMALGMVDEKGVEVKYLPPDSSVTGRAYDYVLLAPFDMGAMPYTEQ